VSIGRRVFRSGESQYRMNGKMVRLKEIKDLLMDTGLGIRAYSVIEQGKIGMILSGKPQERRKLLEEAAGITRYKARKRVAEVKLEEAMANLLRLDDVIGEVERSLRSLKRQASAARRYQQKQEEYRGLLHRVLAARAEALLAKLRDLEERLAAVTARDAELTKELAQGEATLAEGRETLDRMAEEVAALHQKQAEIAATIEGKQEYVKGTRRTLGEITERAGQGRALAERKEADLARWREAVGELEEQRQGMVDDLEAAAGEVDRDSHELAAAERALAQAAARTETLRRQMLEQVAQVNALSKKHQQAEIELEKSNYRKVRLAEELDEHRHETARAAEAVELARDKVAELETRLGEQKAALAKVKQALETTLRREAEATERRRELETDLAAARQRHQLLTELSQAYQERRGRLEAALAAAGLASPTFLAERVEAVEGWERSLDLFLAELTDAVLLDEGAALPLAGSLGEAGAGALLIEPLPGVAESLPVVDDPAVVLSLGEALGLSEPLAAALPPAFLVESPDDARRLARRHPGVAFLCRSGLWAAGGVLHVEAPQGAPGVFERERELDDLSEELPRLEGELERARGELARWVEQRASLAKDQNKHQGDLARLEQELAVARARREDLAHRHERLARQAEEIEAEGTKIDAEAARAAETRRELAGQRQTAQAEHEALEERFDRVRAEVEAAKAERESLKTASADRRGRLELLKERLAAHDREIARLDADIEEGRRQTVSWQEEAERLERRRLELEAGIEAAETALQEALERRAGSQDEVLAAQERLDGKRQELRRLEERIGQIREQRDQVRGSLEELRVERAGLRQDGGHLAGTWEEHFGERKEEEVDGVDRVDSVDGEEETVAESAVQERDEAPVPRPWLEVTCRARGRAGPHAGGARAARAGQRAGGRGVRRAGGAARLPDHPARRRGQSVDSLKRTIREINQTSSERFRETFAEVNEQFGVIFERLFRGGEAEMRLLDEEDLLETGIEIVARPPGKRLQNLMLMSGGEKALTAIALLFALFHTKPSPFCILDEVDAPLDDVNTLRYAETLRELAGDTQFLVITHNKLTMESASTLYGVTMQEKPGRLQARRRRARRGRRSTGSRRSWGWSPPARSTGRCGTCWRSRSAPPAPLGSTR
jgi:chromosome segregation protein